MTKPGLSSTGAKGAKGGPKKVARPARTAAPRSSGTAKAGKSPNRNLVASKVVTKSPKLPAAVHKSAAPSRGKPARGEPDPKQARPKNLKLEKPKLAKPELSKSKPALADAKGAPAKAAKADGATGAVAGKSKVAPPATAKPTIQAKAAVPAKPTPSKTVSQAKPGSAANDGKKARSSSEPVRSDKKVQIAAGTTPTDRKTPAASNAPGQIKAMGKPPKPPVVPPNSSREKSNVKNAGSDGRSPSVPKGKDKATAPTKGGPTKGALLKKGTAPPVPALPAVPAVPARKIQVVQLSTLKPGARGSRSTLVRPVTIEEERDTSGAAKKRRSAELTRQQLDHFKELLEQRRTRLSSDLSLMQDEALKVTGQDNSADSVADNGTDNYEQDFTLGLIESEEALAREVDDALVRIELGTFGVCEGCQTPVPLARLEILPFSRCCVECQQKREGGSRPT